MAMVTRQARRARSRENRADDRFVRRRSLILACTRTAKGPPVALLHMSQ